MATAYDAIVIGGGHNGLVAAAYLARAGRRVLVLERRERVGGAALSEEVFPGFTFSVFSYVVSLLRPEIIRDLDLPRHGLHVLPLESTLTPLPNGDYLAQWNDHDQNRRELARHSLRDAEAYDEFGRLMHQMARAVKPFLGMVPPDPGSFAPRELFALGRLGRQLRGLGREQFHALHKLLTMSSADYLDEWFETEALKATKSASGIIGTLLGPRSPGTAYVLLHHYMGELDGVFRAWGFAKGGNGSVSEAIAGAARALGVEIRTEAPVANVLVENGRATGVVLASGEEIRARRVRLERRSAAHVPRARRREAPACGVHRRDPAVPLPRRVGQGQPCPRCAAGLHLPARRRAAPARRDLDQPERRLPRARLRRRRSTASSRAARTWTS